MLVVTIYFLVGISILFLLITAFVWFYRWATKKEKNSYKKPIARGILYFVDKRPYLRRMGEGYIYEDEKNNKLFVVIENGKRFFIYKILSKGKNTLVFITKNLKRYVFFFYENYGL
jgi:nitrogen fixation-related uncharacterized protein